MIILTGASGGIGKELIPHLTKIDQVIGIYNSSKPKSKPGSNLTYVKLNIADSEEVEDTEEEVDIIKPSEISPIQLHSVVQNIDKIPDNVVELKNILNHIFSKLGNNEITQKQITKIYNTVLDVVGKD